MELKELTEKVLELFEAESPEQLKDKIYTAVLNNDTEKYKGFVEIVCGDLSVDWMQKIYQYYQADRKNLGQDYTPKCLAEFVSMLVGATDSYMVDLCAGSGALTIQNWNTASSKAEYTCVEMDKNVIPYLLFNLAVRNIEATVIHGDALLGRVYDTYKIHEGEQWGLVEVVK